MQSSLFTLFTLFTVLASLWLPVAAFADTTVDTTPAPSNIKLLTDKAKELSGYYSTAKTAFEVGLRLAAALDLIEPRDADAEFKALRETLEKVAAGLNWQATMNFIDAQRGPAIGAIEQLKRDPKTVRAEDDARSSNAAETLALGGGAFYRLQAGDMVYEWRLGIPALLEVIAYRLQFIAAMDPNFRNDNLYDGELERYRSRLKWHLETMLAGINCQWHQPSGTALPAYLASCVDSHTGIIARESHLRGGQQPWWQDPQAVLDKLRGEVMRAMPLFEVRAMIDLLSLYIHSGPDLTEEVSHIAVKAAPHLCLNVQWGNPAPGTPVWLWDCKGGDAQWWVYDRQSDTIHNPAYNRCLDVQWGNPIPGTPVQLWDCNGGDAQRWTYDPVTGVLQSALGTVLDIRGGVMQAQTPVQTWSRHEGPAQQWVTGAYIVQGAILDKWMSLGGKTGFLGAPITDEMSTPDGRGRVTHFQGGSIYWTPETGAREVHGLIRAKWAALGWEKGIVGVYGATIGYPLTDETPTADGIGRVNDFEGASIYWHPDTGAYFVGGTIRDKWWALGAEQSQLRYPISDEASTGNGIERVSAFQGGWIVWDESRGAYEVYR